MAQATPFKRAIAMMAAISAAMACADSQAALAQIGPYVSRGKGKGRGPRMCRTNFHGGGSKYVPHQGKRECARRLAKAGA